MRLDSREWLKNTINAGLMWISEVGNIDCYSFLRNFKGAKLFIELENVFSHSTGLTLLQVASNSVEASNSLYEQLQDQPESLEHCCKL